MNFDHIIVKESPGLCRCCLSEGCYKDLSTEYPWMEDTEVYADMLLECFDISISQHMEGPNGPNRLICEVCITRLRDACNFKKQVLESEKKFVDMVGRGEFRTEVIYEDQMKAEVGLESMPMESEGVEFIEDDFDNESLKDESTSTMAEITAAPLPVKAKKGRPKKRLSGEKTEKKGKAAKLEDKPRTSKAVSKDELGNMKYEQLTSENRRENLKILFENTSIIPFEWRGKYLCFYCQKTYVDYTKFRKHTTSHSLSMECDGRFELRSEDEIKIDISVIKCEICDESYNTVATLIHHLIDEHDLQYDETVDIPFQEYMLEEMRCKFCEEDDFEEFDSLLYHTVEAHPQNYFNCDQCGLKFTCHKDLYFHLKNDHRQDGYLCDECPDIFDDREVLAKHKILFHYKQCNVCSMKFQSDKLLMKHTQSQHPNRKIQLVPKLTKIVLIKRRNIVIVLNMTTAIPFSFFTNFECFYCSEKFVEFDELKVHTVSVHPTCDMDSKAITRYKEEAHVVAKIDISFLTCKVCHKYIPDLDKMIDHLISKHEAKYDKTTSGCFEPFKVGKDSTPCPQCPKVFRYFATLLRHVNREHSRSNLVCNYCGRNFRRSSNLAVHVSIAHSELCECEDCGMKFKNQWCLARHKAKMHGLKQFKCSKCSEMFQSPYIKYKHMIQEHNIGHKCPHCDRMFTRNSFMKAHVRRVHLKDKDVACNLCDEMFYDNYTLKLHLVKQHGDRRFSCHVCGDYFMRQSNLDKHLETHNDVEYEEIEELEDFDEIKETEFEEIEELEVTEGIEQIEEVVPFATE